MLRLTFFLSFGIVFFFFSSCRKDKTVMEEPNFGEAYYGSYAFTEENAQMGMDAVWHYFIWNYSGSIRAYTAEDALQNNGNPLEATAALQPITIVRDYPDFSTFYVLIDSSGSFEYQLSNGYHLGGKFINKDSLHFVVDYHPSEGSSSSEINAVRID